MKINDTLDDDEELTSIGSFPAWEAERVIKLLESAQIPFEIDVTDEQIRNQNVIIAQYGGTFGDGARITIYIYPGFIDAFKALYEQKTDTTTGQMYDEIKSEADDSLIERPNLIALLGYWVICGVCMTGGILLGIGLWQRVNPVVLIGDAIFCIFMGALIYRMTQEYIKAKKRAEQGATANA